MSRIDELLAEALGGYWLCACCGQWRQGMPIGHNTEGPVCGSCNVWIQGCIPEALLRSDAFRYGSAVHDAEAWR